MIGVEGLIGRKIGMIGVFENGEKFTGATVIEVLPNVIVDRVMSDDGKCIRVRLGYGERKIKNTPKPLLAIFDRAKTAPKARIMEFKWFEENIPEYGQVIKVEEVFQEGEKITVTGYSKGKGFQGVVKRHGFAGVGTRSHGQHNRERAPGSIGSSTYPGRVIKGLRMAGRTGNEKVTIHNLKILKIFPEKNLLVIKGSVPGYRGAYIKLRK